MRFDFDYGVSLFLFTCDLQRIGDGRQLDLDKLTDTLEPEDTTTGGLFVPGKDRVVFRPPEKKSILGLIHIFVVLKLL